MSSDNADLSDSVTISCHKCKIEKTRNFFGNPLTKEEFDSFKKKDNRTCPYCKAPMEYSPHTISESTVAQKQLSLEDWRDALLEKYQCLMQVCNDNLPGLRYSLDFVLSIQKIMHISDCTLPFAGILLGSPSSLKTVGIELFRKWHHVFYTDSFSAKAFVSHSTSVKKQDLDKIDMLPKIKNKLLLTPELSPTFAKKDDDLIEFIGIMSRILDGHGYESDTGAQGHRGYNEPMMFTWIGAAVDIPHKVHRYLGTIGPKLYFLRLQKSTKTEDQYYNELDANFADKISNIKPALDDYLEWFEKCPELIMDIKSGLLKIVWDSKKDDANAKRYIIRLARLLAHLRGVVPTWHTDDTDGLGYGYALATIEEPDRAITQLRNLARGHALSRGRNYITIEDISLVIDVVFSTASKERVKALELLLSNGGKLTTSDIANTLNISSNTAKRTMAEFKALGLVELNDGDNNNSEKEINLYQSFSWFLSEEFNKLAVRNLPPIPRDGELQVLKSKDKSSDNGGHFSDSKIIFLKCPDCNFKNIHQTEIDHHRRLTHT